MLEPEVAALSDALFKAGVYPNKEVCVTWARKVIEKLRDQDYLIVHSSKVSEDGGMLDAANDGP